MAKGPAPEGLIRRLEDLFNGENPDEVIFALSLTLGNMIGQAVRVDMQELTVAVCLNTIRSGLEGAKEAKKAKEKIEISASPSTNTKH